MSRKKSNRGVLTPDDWIQGKARWEKWKEKRRLQHLRYQKEKRKARPNWYRRKDKLQREWRKIIFQRDNYKCRYCGNNSNLHLHHIEMHNRDDCSPIKKLKMSYRDDNLITLCKECHNKVHSPRYHRIKTWIKRL